MLASAPWRMGAWFDRHLSQYHRLPDRAPGASQRALGPDIPPGPIAGGMGISRQLSASRHQTAPPAANFRIADDTDEIAGPRSRFSRQAWFPSNARRVSP